MAVKKSIAIIGEGETEWWYFDTLRIACRYKFKVAPTWATFRLLILVLMSMFFAQRQQLLEERNPLRLQFASVVQLPIVAKPVHVAPALLRDVLRGVALLPMDERHHLLVFLLPDLVLCHRERFNI